MPRARTTLVWGQGLDRATGALASDDATFLDLRNLLVRDSKLLARGGIVLPATGAPFTDMTYVVTDIVAIIPMRSQRGSVVIGYDRSARTLTVWSLDGLGGTATLIGLWDTLIADSPLPVVVGAEGYGKMFLAHAEPLYNYRVKTIYYDPSLSPGSQLVDVTANLDGAGSNTVFARGVYAYLDYIWYYGYGTDSDANRPETVRFSLPGDPANLDPQQYFIAGAIGEAVTGLLACDGQLRVNKAGRAYTIKGTNASDFGVFPLEEIYGQINDRMSFPFGAVGVMWGEHGPRITVGDGTTADIALPLELDGPPPDGLTEQGLDAYAWSVYEPQERIGLFAFPVLDPVAPKTLVYVLSLRQPGVIRWTYFELQQCIYSSGLVIEGAPSIGTSMTAYADMVVATDTGPSGTGRTINVAWNNNALIGGETVQVFKRTAGGSWVMAGTIAASGGSQDLDLLGSEALLDHDIAVRFVKGGFATPGYQSADPDSWTATTAPGSKTTVTTDCAAPTALVGVWSRIGMSTHQIAFGFNLAALNVGFELQQSNDGVGGWADVETEADPYNTRSIVHITADAILATHKFYRLRAVRGANTSAYSTVDDVYLGPTALPVVELLVQTGTTAHFELWLRTVPAPGPILEVQTSPDGVTGWVSEFYNATFSRKQSVLSPIALGSVTYVRTRYLVNSFTVADAGEWVAAGNIKLTNTAPPAAPTSTIGVWVAANSIALGFDAPGASLGTLAEYVASADSLPKVSAVLPDGIEIDLSDIRDRGGDLSYRPYGIGIFFTPVPIENASLYTVNAAAGQFKISAAVVVSTVMTFDGPDNVTPSTPSFGQLQVDWDNVGTPATITFVFWFTPDLSLSSFLNVSLAIAGGHQALTGPPIGLTALPPNGTPIVVRTFQQDFAGARNSTYTDVPWVVGT